MAVTAEQDIILKREFRHPHYQEFIGIPGGTVEPEEADSLIMSKHEFLEETGYVSDEWMDFEAVIEESRKLTNRGSASGLPTTAGRFLTRDWTKQRSSIFCECHRSMRLCWSWPTKSAAQAQDTGILRAAHMLGI